MISLFPVLSFFLFCGNFILCSSGINECRLCARPLVPESFLIDFYLLLLAKSNFAFSCGSPSVLPSVWFNCFILSWCFVYTNPYAFYPPQLCLVSVV